MNTATTTSIIIAIVLVVGLLIWGATSHKPVPNQSPTSQDSARQTPPAPLTTDQMNMNDLSEESQSITSTDVQFSNDLNNLQADTSGL